MKALQKFLLSKWGLLLLVIGMVIWVFVMVTQQAQSQGDIQAYPPPPTDILIPYPSDNTATPDQTQISEWKATIYPTSTPFVFSETIDLSPELSDAEKYYIFVQKDNGEIIFYLIGPAPSDADVLTTIPETILDKLPLQANDVIIRWQPPSPIRRSPPEEPSTIISPTIVSTNIPVYP